MSTTFLGTTTFLVDDGETKIFIDAFISHVPLSYFCFPWKAVGTDERRVKEVLGELDVRGAAGVFVSHSHHDHAFDAAYLTEQTEAVLHGSESTRQIGLGGGLPKERVHVVQPGTRTPSGTFYVRAIESRHSPCVLGGAESTIDELVQPSSVWCYKSGRCFDFMVECSDGASMLFKGAANFIPGQLQDENADVLFLGIATLGSQTREFRRQFVRETIEAVNPRVVVPTHWNDMFQPVSRELGCSRIENTAALLSEIGEYTEGSGREFRILDGFGRIVLPLPSG